MKGFLNRRWLSILIGIPLLISILISSACGGGAPQPSAGPQSAGSAPPVANSGGQSGGQPAGGSSGSSYYNPGQSGGGSAPAASGSGNIGLSAGGAKDVVSFRENIGNKYLPLPTDITYEGLYYDYFFDTGASGEQPNKLFYPGYSYAVSKDPISGQTEYYLSVGLNSGLKESDFERKKLNLVIVLDISDSMNGAFNNYYYDPSGNKHSLSWLEQSMTKISVAKDAIVSLLNHLNEDDRLGIVVFNDRAYTSERFGRFSQENLAGLKRRISNISATSSTNLASGMAMATDMLRDYADTDPADYENRIIFLTDAMPNTGDFSESGLLGMARNNAKSRIYSTFIGIGVDFNSELVNYITQTKGANYYSVYTPGEFRERMDDQFEYMVTPLVFDVKLFLDSAGWDIDTVYGSPEANAATGELMKVNTMFPSKREGGETKGGLILLKLRKRSAASPPEAGGSLKLRVTYEDRQGVRDGSDSVISFETLRPEYFENSGIRKGILLARYADLVKNWLIDERSHVQYSKPWDPVINERDGIIRPAANLSTWERQSMSLTVARPYRNIFADFLRYFKSEKEAIGDRTLDQEADILDRLAGFNSW